MAGAKFQYDESGGTFFYFLLSFLALIVIPCTYYFWPTDKRKDVERRDNKSCHCQPCVLKNSRLRAREPWRKAKQRIIKFLLILGWLALLATAYKVAHIQHDYIQWDPFEILQIDPASSMGEIKKAYRKLSLVYHPDKETGDAKKFMMIAKAYAALTDDEARKNWETYGNPDGPGATSFGIALPSWIVEKENSVWVLGLYALVFMVALPVAVGVWWYRSVKFGGDQVLLDTTQLYYYFVHKTPNMTLKRVIMILGSSLEFERGHNSEVVERPTDNVEVPALIKEFPNLGEKNKERPLCFGYSIKARALLHAHLNRHDLPKNTLELDKLLIVKKCPYLLQELVQSVSSLTMLALAGRINRMPNLDTMENAMKLCPMVVQGLWSNKSPLLQLPHISEDFLRHFTSRKHNIKSLHNLASMKNKDRRTIMRNFSQEQYEDVMNVLAKMPFLEMEVRSEVLDDEDSCTITANAIVTVNVTLHRKDLSTVFDQDVSSIENELDESSIHHTEEQQQAAPQETAPQWKSKDKQKKKKGKGGANKQKKKLQAANKANMKKVASKAAAEETAVSKAEAPTKTNDDKKSKDAAVAADSDSAAESESDDSDREQGGGSSHSSNEGGGGAGDTKKANHVGIQEEQQEDEEDWLKFQKIAKKDKVLETKSKKSHSVHCPYFPEDKQEYWWIYIANRKNHSLVTVPYLMTNLVEKEEVDLKFTAPSKPGIYSYSVIARSDSYIDFDVVKTIKLDVKEAKKIDLANPQWDISDEEEDKDQDESAVEDSDLASDDDDIQDSPDDD